MIELKLSEALQLLSKMNYSKAVVGDEVHNTNEIVSDDDIDVVGEYDGPGYVAIRIRRLEQEFYLGETILTAYSEPVLNIQCALGVEGKPGLELAGQWARITGNSVSSTLEWIAGGITNPQVAASAIEAGLSTEEAVTLLVEVTDTKWVKSYARRHGLESPSAQQSRQLILQAANQGELRLPWESMTAAEFARFAGVEKRYLTMWAKEGRYVKGAVKVPGAGGGGGGVWTAPYRAWKEAVEIEKRPGRRKGQRTKK